ncbi:MAG: hypothetical protein GX147_04185 [Deltaproteobacteria bacterium]|jgi:hypothetical protein|nr:hypothetical protein [Deltaproteobacteria bacterium]
MGFMGLAKKLGAAFLAVCMMATVAYAEEDEKTKAPTARQEAIEVEKGGVLVEKRRWVIEPGVQYSHTDRTRVAISGFTILEAIHFGTIKSEDIKKDVIMSFLNIRYGLTDNLQMELKIPYLFRRDRVTYLSSSGGQERTAEYTTRDDAMGDIEGGLYYHLVHERGGIPDVVINFKGKSRTGKDPYGLKMKKVRVGGVDPEKDVPAELPTGSGHYGLSAGVTVAKTSDPAVLFGTLAYYYNFERDPGRASNGSKYGDIKPGDSIEAMFGMAYALNERLSANISYQQRFFFKTKQGGKKIKGTDYNVGSLNLGSYFALTDRVGVSLSVGVGLTDDAADTTVEIRLPFRF